MISAVIFVCACRFVFGSGQNMTLTVNVLLTCILNRDSGPGYD